MNEPQHLANIEEKRLNEEVRLRELEIGIERDKLEFEFKHKERIKFSPLLTTAIAAVCALLGTILGAYINGISNLNLERQKFESNLILKAVETGDQKEAIGNLNFFVKAGFIDDANNKISNLLKENQVPVLPRSDGASHTREIELTISSSKDVYTVGEKIQFHVRANQDCFIRMFYYSSDGSSYHLFPSKYSQDNLLKKNSTIVIPIGDSPFALIASEPVGIEVAVVMASTEQYPDLINPDWNEMEFPESKEVNLTKMRGILVKEINKKEKAGLIESKKFSVGYASTIIEIRK